VTHSRRIGWPSVLIVLSVLALGLVGVGLAGVTRHDAAANVNVTFTDTKLVVSHGTVQAGPATFVVVNKGRKSHVLTISGPGIVGVRSQEVKSGKSARLTVTLRKGAYMLADRIIRGSSSVRWLVVAAATPTSGSKREVQPFPPPAPMDCD